MDPRERNTTSSAKRRQEAGWGGDSIRSAHGLPDRLLRACQDMVHPVYISFPVLKQSLLRPYYARVPPLPPSVLPFFLILTAACLPPSGFSVPPLPRRSHLPPIASSLPYLPAFSPLPPPLPSRPNADVLTSLAPPPFLPLFSPCLSLHPPFPDGLPLLPASDLSTPCLPSLPSLSLPQYSFPFPHTFANSRTPTLGHVAPVISELNSHIFSALV